MKSLSQISEAESVVMRMTVCPKRRSISCTPFSARGKAGEIRMGNQRTDSWFSFGAISTDACRCTE